MFGTADQFRLSPKPFKGLDAFEARQLYAQTAALDSPTLGTMHPGGTRSERVCRQASESLPETAHFFS